MQHPIFAHALCDVAVLLHDSGRFAEAELLSTQALAIYEASFGADHPVVAACLNNVAELFADDGRLAEAEQLYRRALASDEATYGPDHTNVARDLNNLAGLLAAEDRSPEAEPMLARRADDRHGKLRAGSSARSSRSSQRGPLAADGGRCASVTRRRRPLAQYPPFSIARSALAGPPPPAGGSSRSSSRGA